jgi:hypothetical protein
MKAVHNYIIFVVLGGLVVSVLAGSNPAEDDGF